MRSLKSSSAEVRKRLPKATPQASLAPSPALRTDDAYLTQSVKWDGMFGRSKTSHLGGFCSFILL